jgi:hypothetical protein
MLTDAGKRFAHLETDARKKLFAEHLINFVPVMGLIRRVLDERPSHTACACRKSNPNILVDRAAKNGPRQLDGARDRRILLQR